MPADVETRFVSLRQTAACVNLTPSQVQELILVADELVAERKRIRELLHELPTNFTEVRRILNELAKAVG